MCRKIVVTQWPMLYRNVKLTRAEPGYLAFDVVLSDDIPGRYLVSEVFTDQEAFDAHQSRMKNSNWFTVTQGIPRDYTIRKGE
ncbi:antibiotic biosynthesis monooxygenase family protein [Agrobacterium larrymoorei]|uniref:antibiotic biosynthesis monooxygenase family protein n=1 Tax=Agrobacterium larrymoorei TaxID=160699 RepID=UPI0030BBDA0C